MEKKFIGAGKKIKIFAVAIIIILKKMCVRFIYYSCDIDVEIFMSPRLFIIDVC
jgi:hypothetical protein